MDRTQGLAAAVLSPWRETFVTVTYSLDEDGCFVSGVPASVALDGEAAVKGFLEEHADGRKVADVTIWPVS